MEDKKYPIELEVITPLCVGAGNDNDWVKGIDFVQKGGKVYVIDMQETVAHGVPIDQLTNLFLKNDEAGISLLLGNQIEQLSKYVFDAPARTDNNIKTFLRTQLYNKPLVAGSSIKGSVRSALFNYLRTNEEKNEEVFGTMKDGTDFMRFIHIGDIEMPSTILVNSKIFNLRKEGEEWRGGWKHFMSKTTGDYSPTGFNTLYECVVPGNKGLGNISLAVNAFSLLEKYGQGKSPYADKKHTLLNEPVNCLFQVINDVTKGYLQKEHAFFMKYDAERSDEVTSCIESLLSMIPTDGSCCLLKMSAGVGFHSITGDWQYDDYDETGFRTDYPHAGKKKYKSRKIAEYEHRLQLMGFVRLRALSEDEAKERAATLQHNHKDLINNILQPIRQHEAERKLKLAEEQERKRKAEEKKKKKEAFVSLLEQSRMDYSAGTWSEAIAHAEEALRLFPDNNEAIELIAKIKKAQEVEIFRQQEVFAAEHKFSQPLADVLRGKSSSAGNLIGTLAKWLKKNGRILGETEYAALLTEAQKLPDKEKKNLKAKCKNLLNEEQIQRLLRDLSLA